MCALGILIHMLSLQGRVEELQAGDGATFAPRVGVACIQVHHVHDVLLLDLAPRRINLDATRPKRRSLVTRSDEASKILGGRDIRRLVTTAGRLDISRRVESGRAHVCGRCGTSEKVACGWKSRQRDTM